MTHREAEELLQKLFEAYKEEGGNFQQGLALFSGFAMAQLGFIMGGGSVDIIINSSERILAETLAKNELKRKEDERISRQ